MNEELIRQIASEKGFGPASEQAVEQAIHLYHARHVAPLEKAMKALETALIRDMGAGYAGVALIQAALAPFQQEAK